MIRRVIGLLVVLLLSAAGAALCRVPVAVAAVERAIVDAGLVKESADERARHLAEIGGQLGAKHVRLEVQWPKLEPQAGVYDEGYLASLDELVTLARANGIKVMLTFVYVPEWAFDDSFWDTPPGYGGYTQPYVYYPVYVPREDAADEFGAMVATVARRLKGKVFAYECYNEPNLGLFLYPQQVRANGGFVDVALPRYALLLKACHAAIENEDPEALVVGGTTSPIGEGSGVTFSRWRTNPVYWAQAMMDLGLAPSFDAYSHHPYSPGPRVLAPEAAPVNPETTVGLQNLGTLLAIVPGKPFYLTEYGYNTAPSNMFGVSTGLTQAQQADYLRRAYTYAARYTRVKALFWYLRQDASPSGSATDANGVYTGLRTTTGSPKRSWFAFARGMALSLAARSPVERGALTRMTGRLTWTNRGTSTITGLKGKQLDVQRRIDGAWKTVKHVTTRSGGSYTTYLRLYGDARVRLLWRGVVTSRSRLVDVR